MLDFLKRESLFASVTRASFDPYVAYSQFLCDVGSSLNGTRLKGEHGVLALCHQSVINSSSDVETYVEASQRFSTRIKLYRPS